MITRLQYEANADAALAAEMQQRGTMRPKTNDPDEGVRQYGSAVELIYDEVAGVWREPHMIGDK